jgi:hypothetical protein
MPVLGSELLGPLAGFVIVLVAFWATFLRDPPLAYSRARYLEMQNRALRAEDAVDYFTREAVEARLEQQQDAKVLEYFGRRLTPGREAPPAPGVWERPFDPNRGDS